MSTEVSTEEHDQLINELVEEFGFDESSAEACLIAADWDPEIAREVASLNKVDHLLVKCRFTGRSPIPHGGVFTILFARGHEMPVHILGQTFDGLEIIDEMSPHFSSLEFLKALLNPPKHPRDVSQWHNLKATIEKYLEEISIDEMVFGVVEEDSLETNEDGLINEHSPLKTRLWEMIREPIDDYYTETVKLDVVPEFLSGFQLENLNELLEVVKPKQEEKSEEIEKKKEEVKETFKLVLKGRLIIDPQEGVPVEELSEGDTLVCDVVDTSPVAKEAGKMLGVYKKGMWFPIKGRIESIEDGLAGAKRIRMTAGGGVYIEGTALSAVKVKVSENELVGILRRIETDREDSARSILNMLPLALVILGIALALTILLQRG